MKNEEINLQRLDYKEQRKVLDIIYSDETLRETFGGNRNTLSRLSNASYVATINKDDKPVGFIMIVDNEKDKTSEIDMGILTKHRGKGYGTEALKQLKELIIKNNLENIKIQVRKENIGAIKSVLNSGFVLLKDDEYHNYYTISKEVKHTK